MSQEKKLSQFKGIQNVFDKGAPSSDILVEATNVCVSAEGVVVHRPGMEELVSATISSSYGTFDHRYLFYISLGFLYKIGVDGISVLLGPIGGDSWCWCEESSDRVFLIAGSIIHEITTTGIAEVSTIPHPGLAQVLIPFVWPGVAVDAAWAQGSLCVASYFGGASRISFSAPSMAGLASIEESWFEIPDQVLDIESISTGVIIACTRSVYFYDIAPDTLIKKLQYGSVSGHPIIKISPERAYIWTIRGVVDTSTWANMTETHYAVPSGGACESSVFLYEGDEYLVVSTSSGGYNYNYLTEGV